jgi:7-carboxy-7-deazaguanine synthase
MNTPSISSRAEQLRITEIFYSLQGESSTVGLPTVFIRLTGCPLRCGYCDTAYAFTGGELVATKDIIAQVRRYKTNYVTVTGGEPLAQKACLGLLSQLCDEGYQVSLETSGAMDISPVDARVQKVMDLKTPGSGEERRNVIDNLQSLRAQDQVKFVICDRCDYDWSVEMLRQHQLTSRCGVLFSPSYGQLDGIQLAQWILQDQLPVRFQLQLHKILWGDQPGK